MILAGQDCPDNPTVPSEKVRILRARLIMEEALETVEALGVTISVPTGNDDLFYLNDHFKQLDFDATHEPDLVEIADGCADISVVTLGTLVACGITDVRLLEMVDLNNLDKFGPGHSRSPEGKLIKPPGHKPPDIAGLLKLLETNGCTSNTN